MRWIEKKKWHFILLIEIIVNFETKSWFEHITNV